MSETLETRPVYYHQCPALGPQTRVPRALLADRGGEYVLGYQHKCPMCSFRAGNFEPASGVTVNSDGSYTVDTSKAERFGN